jgi:hypothetical protein
MPNSQQKLCQTLSKLTNDRFTSAPARVTWTHDTLLFTIYSWCSDHKHYTCIFEYVIFISISFRGLELTIAKYFMKIFTLQWIKHYIYTSGDSNPRPSNPNTASMANFQNTNFLISFTCYKSGCSKPRLMKVYKKLGNKMLIYSLLNFAPAARKVFQKSNRFCHNFHKCVRLCQTKQKSGLYIHTLLKA